MSACILRWAALGLLLTMSGCRSVSAPPSNPDPGRLASPSSTAAVADETPSVTAASVAGTTEAALPQSAVPAAVPGCVPQGAASRPAVREKPKSQARPTVVLAQTPPPAPARDRRIESGPIPVAVSSVLGKKVRDAHGDDVGRVVDVLADADGRVRLAVIEFGGFLGVGNRRVAVDWNLLRFAPDKDRPVSLSVSQETLQQAPEYKTSARPMALTAPPPGVK